MEVAIVQSVLSNAKKMKLGGMFSAIIRSSASARICLTRSFTFATEGPVSVVVKFKIFTYPSVTDGYCIRGRKVAKRYVNLDG